MLLAAASTIVIGAVRMYYGPWANPPGMAELGALFLTLAAAIALWRAFRRSRAAPKG